LLDQGGFSQRIWGNDDARESAARTIDFGPAYFKHVVPGEAEAQQKHDIDEEMDSKGLLGFK